MTDEELINQVAQLWVANGGDAKGIDYCVEKIKNAINSLGEK